MRFAHPDWFVFIVPLLAGLVSFMVWARAQRKRALLRFADEHLLKDLIAQVDFSRRRTQHLLVICAFGLALFSLARPQWGFQWQEVKRRGLDIIIALDTSKSMLAEDIKPNRIGRAKLAISDCTRFLRGDRIGLVAFSGSAFLQCPLTVDYSGFLFTLQGVDTDIIPRPGTNLAAAIREAVRAFEAGMKKYQVLVIITDGEDLEGDALDAAGEAKKRGVIIHCIGVGTAEGELIPVLRSDGQRDFLKDVQGNVVKTRLDERLLQKIALDTGGSYVRSTAREFALEALYRDKISQMEKREIEGQMARHFHERFQIPLGIAVLLLLIAPFISEKKGTGLFFAQRQDASKNKPVPFLALLFLAATINLAYAGSDAPIVAKGNKLYRLGRYGDALSVYKEGLIAHPDSTSLNFNAGAASYKSGDFQTAMGSFERALLAEDTALLNKARYNLATAAYRRALAQKETDPDAAIGLMEESLRYYRAVIDDNSQDTDARYNYEFVREELEKLKQQTQDQQCPNPQKSGEEQKEQEQDTQEQPRQPQDEEKNQEEEQEQQQQDQQRQEQQEESAPQQAPDEPQEMSPEQARMLLGGVAEERSLQQLLNDQQKNEAGAVLKNW